MGMAKKLLPSFAYGTGFGTLFYILGSVAHSVASAIDPTVAFVLGFASAVAIELSKEEKAEK